MAQQQSSERGEARDLPWEDLLGMDLRGRELRLVEQQGTTQGPIQRVEVKGRMAHFQRAPVRTQLAGSDQQEVCEEGDNCVAANIDELCHAALLYADGTITFQIMYIGEVTIFPHVH